MNEKQTSVALYARVSTSDKGQDPQMQLREMRSHAQAQGWTVHEEYIDHGVSGAKDSRPALNRLMSDAQACAFDAVMVWKLDRFSRSLRHLVVSLETLAAAGVAFVSLRDNLDLTTASGRLMFQMIGAFAEFERALTSERVRAGLRNARAKGKQLGRKARTDIDVPEIARLRAEGLDWRQIAAITGVPRSTCYRLCPKNLLQSA
jgi:DNA invertase Pin-like site-specific DNA recombinase